MASKPKYHLSIKTGSYTTKDGKTRSRWRKFATMMEKDDGGIYGFLDLTFNPAGVPHDADQSEAIFSFFPVDEVADDRPNQKKAPPAQEDGEDFKDDIPF
jgi:hypothetical protein